VSFVTPGSDVSTSWLSLAALLALTSSGTALAGDRPAVRTPDADPPNEPTAERYHPGMLVAAEEPAGLPPEPPPPSEPVDTDLGNCTLFPDPACRHSLVVELGVALGERRSNLPPLLLVRSFLEVGFLTAVRLPGQHLHLGPVFALAVETGPVSVAWVASPRVRARYFAGGTHFVIEHALGPQFQRFAYHDALETGTRAGIAADISFGYGGIIGPLGELSALADLGGNDGVQLAYVAGLRFNVTALALGLSGIGKGPFLR